MTIQKWLAAAPDYEGMNARYTRFDGALALGFYLLLLGIYAFDGLLLLRTGLHLGIWTNLFLTLLCIALVLLRRQGLASIGFTKKRLASSLLCGFGFGLLLFLVFISPQLFAKRPLADTRTIFYNLFYYFFIIGLSEEIIFRGYIQTRIHAFFRSDKAATVVGALLFGLMHIPFQAASRGMSLPAFLQSNWSMVLIPFLWHFVLNFLYRKFNSIAAPTILHGFMNFSTSIFR